MNERLIDANKLEADMYHNAFEIDTDLQKWDSGCWIRYKMFENVIDEQPTVDVIPKEFIKQKIDEYLELGLNSVAKELNVILAEWEKENESNSNN